MHDPLPGSFADLAAKKGAAGTPAGCLAPAARSAAAAGDGGDPSALLHRYSNNSPQGASTKGYKLGKRATIYRGQVGLATVAAVVADGVGEGVDKSGRAWALGDDGQTWERMFGGLTSAEAKRAYALRVNVEAFTDHYRHEQCAFLTLTAQESDMTPKEFGAIWDDMRKTGRGHVGLTWLRSYVRVLEAQKRGSPHYHLVVATPYDLQPAAFDWDALRGSYEARKSGDFGKAKALTRQYAESATPELRAIWSELRAVCERYGLGRSEMLPFRKEAGAVAHYVGKYLEGGLSYRRDSWRGARRVEYDRKESRTWKRCGSSFGWVSPGASAWRGRVGELARAIGADDADGLRRTLGPRWAYYFRPTIMTASEPEWRRLMQYTADKYGGRVDRRTAMQQGGEALAWYPSSDEGIDCGAVCTRHTPEGLVLPTPAPQPAEMYRLTGDGVRVE